MDTQHNAQESCYPSFPQQSIVGSLGKLAQVLSKGTEVSEEFIFASALTCFGAMVSGNLEVKIGIESDTRLYTVLLGESYTARKSSAMLKTLNFFKGINPQIDWKPLNGVGSAEGLGRWLSQHRRTLLVFDELRAFAEKTKIQSSTLLESVTILFESHIWSNALKDKATEVSDARLSLLACCTTQTYERIWEVRSIDMGFPNRLFLVHADARPRVAWPPPPDEAEVKRLAVKIEKQIANSRETFEISVEAEEAWKHWYDHLPKSVHTKRLDTIGRRLIPIFAQTMDKDCVDLDVIERVIPILNYELRLRQITDPIDADNRVARLEEKIRRKLNGGEVPPRKLRQDTHADREGLWAFERALENLLEAGDIEQLNDDKKILYRLKHATTEPDMRDAAGVAA